MLTLKGSTGKLHLATLLSFCGSRYCWHIKGKPQMVYYMFIHNSWASILLILECSSNFQDNTRCSNLSNLSLNVPSVWTMWDKSRTNKVEFDETRMMSYVRQWWASSTWTVRHGFHIPLFISGSQIHLQHPIIQWEQVALAIPWIQLN